MKRILIGLSISLLLILGALIFAPARLASKALESAFPRAPLGLHGAGTNTSGGQPEIRLLGASGTLWKGAGQLLVNRTPIGDLQWQTNFSNLFALEAALDWKLQGDGFSAEGTAAARGKEYDLRSVHAVVGNDLLRNFLGTYDIAPSGDLNINELDITNLRLNEAQDWPAAVTANGVLSWDGGPVRYRLSGRTSNIELPPMRGVIKTPERGQHPGWPQLQVLNAEDGALLITGRLTPSGSAAIGITRGFTKLAGQPWPGSDPDHTVVLEVEEQLN